MHTRRRKEMRSPIITWNWGLFALNNVANLPHKWESDTDLKRGTLHHSTVLLYTALLYACSHRLASYA